MIQADRADGERPQRVDVGTVGERLRVLDGFRGLAIAAVLCYHYGWAWSEPVNLYGYGRQYWSGFSLGRLGVQFFFMISGFVIPLTLERCRRAREFACRRFARIYPAFSVACVASFVITHAFGPEPMRSAPRDLLFGLALVPPPWFHGRFVDTVFWSLIVEAQFYLAVALAYFRSGRRLVLGWSLALALMLAAWMLLPAVRSPLSLAGYAGFFTAGMAFQRLHSAQRGAFWLLIAAAASYLITCRGLGLAEHGLVVVMLGAFGLISRRGARVFCTMPLVFFGTISYALYLLHQNLGLLLIRAATDAGVPDWLAALFAVSVCVMLALAMTHWIEAPAKHWLLGRWRSIR